MKKNELKKKITQSLLSQGFALGEDGALKLSLSSKDHIRSIHKVARQHHLDNNRKFINENCNFCMQFFADGKDLSINEFAPTVIPIESNSEYARLYRFASLLWSIPVSNGFGRRQRFIVIDQYNNKLVGIFALGDPVYNMKIRDEHIGWKNADRKMRLYNLMDLFVAGAFPPYSNLLCGKLISMLAVSNETRKFIAKKYKKNSTIIQQAHKDSRLVAITTSSALGRSSQYNRLTFNGKKLFEPIGFSQGWGHFHLTNGLYSSIKDFLKSIDSPELRKNNFGDGPNWKFRILRVAFKELGLPQEFLFHGIQRQLFIAPLATNYINFFNKPNVRLRLFDYSQDELIDYFKTRWFYPRAERDTTYKKVDASKTIAYIRG